MTESENESKPQRTMHPGRWVFGFFVLLFLSACTVLTVRSIRYYAAIAAVEKYGGVVQRLDMTWMSNISETPLLFFESKVIVYFQESPLNDLDDQSLRKIIPHLKHIHNMEWLRLENSDITDSVIPQLAVFEQLRGLNLIGTEVSDAGLEHLAPLANLEFLYLSDTKVTDKGIHYLKTFTKLDRLYLDHTEISDEGIAELKFLTNLKHLSLSNTGVTDEGCADLLKAIPDLEISDD